MSTTFPNATQSFKRWEDLTQAQLTAYVKYIDALNSGRWNSARQIFKDGGLSNAMLPTAKDFNDMCDTILECKRLYEAPTTSAQGIQDFMNQFAYKGVFSAENMSQYKKFTLIKYQDALYMAVTDITSSDPPPQNTTQWVGIRKTSYVNMLSTYCGEWASNTNYVVGDVVIYNNAMYLANNDNYNVRPSQQTYDWILAIDFNKYMATISPIEPTGQPNGAIWFKQL